jgi:RNA polymerase sigma factor (sigma-70 family)
MKVSDSDWAAWKDTRLAASRWAEATAKLAEATKELAEVKNGDSGAIARCEAAVADAQVEAEASERALCVLFDRLWRWTVEMAGGSEDAAQNGWAKVRKHCKKFWGDGSSPAYLATVMRNARLDEIKRNKRIERRHTALAAQPPVRAPFELNAEQRAMTKELLQTLPEREARVFRMSTEGFGVTEIASSLGMTDARVRAALRRARELLHKNPSERRVTVVPGRRVSSQALKRRSQ